MNKSTATLVSNETVTYSIQVTDDMTVRDVMVAFFNCEHERLRLNLPPVTGWDLSGRVFLSTSNHDAQVLSQDQPLWEQAHRQPCDMENGVYSFTVRTAVEWKAIQPPPPPPQKEVFLKPKKTVGKPKRKMARTPSALGKETKPISYFWNKYAKVVMKDGHRQAGWMNKTAAYEFAQTMNFVSAESYNFIDGWIADTYYPIEDSESWGNNTVYARVPADEDMWYNLFYRFYESSLRNELVLPPCLMSFKGKKYNFFGLMLREMTDDIEEKLGAVAKESDEAWYQYVFKAFLLQNPDMVTWIKSDPTRRNAWNEYLPEREWTPPIPKPPALPTFDLDVEEVRSKRSCNVEEDDALASSLKRIKPSDDDNDDRTYSPVTGEAIEPHPFDEIFIL